MTLLSTLLWVTSHWWIATVVVGAYGIQLKCGVLSVHFWPPQIIEEQTLFTIESRDEPVEGIMLMSYDDFNSGWSRGFTLPSYDYEADYPCVLFIPMWTLLLLGVLLLWRGLSRRIKAGTCVQCGYDLTGNVSGVCPECGRPIAVHGGVFGPPAT